jgi:hypothetical protein
VVEIADKVKVRVLKKDIADFEENALKKDDKDKKDKKDKKDDKAAKADDKSEKSDKSDKSEKSEDGDAKGDSSRKAG